MRGVSIRSLVLEELGASNSGLRSLEVRKSGETPLDEHTCGPRGKHLPVRGSGRPFGFPCVVPGGAIASNEKADPRLA